MPLTGTIGLEPILTVLETAALPIKLCSINSRKPVEKRERGNSPHFFSFIIGSLRENLNEITSD